MIRIAVIGAGAAGCFCAIELRRRMPEAEVTVLEAGPKALAKVAVTGGGRCNLTNSFERPADLKLIYPRGTQLMKRALRSFSHLDTWSWFEHEGVRLVLQEDGCVFPVSQDAMQIVRTLERLMRNLGVKLECGCRVERIEACGADSPRYRLSLKDGSCRDFDRVIVTAGGCSRNVLDGMFGTLGLEIAAPVPSLFTLKLGDERLKNLMGTVVDYAQLSLAGSNMRSEGTLLITDWGISGPATLKLSSYAARTLAESQYSGTVLINWLGAGEAEVREWLARAGQENARKQAASVRPAELTERLWRMLLGRAGIREDKRWAEIGSKGMNRLVSVLTADAYAIEGRARFKEEFVTCGGVALSNIDINSLECKRWPGLYLAGEVLDIDAITGGFNLQAAWSTGIIAARQCADSCA